MYSFIVEIKVFYKKQIMKEKNYISKKLEIRTNV